MTVSGRAGRQAVILAGGAGTRLAARLNGAPKPLVPVDGVPLLERQLRLLSDQGFTDVLLLVNYRAEAVREFCDEIAIPGLSVNVRLDGGAARGTAGAVWDAAGALAERFLVVYGDTLFDIDLERMWRAHDRAARDGDCVGTLFLHPNDHPYDSDLVDMADDGTIRAFYGKPHEPGVYRRNLVNAALYIIEKSALARIAVADGIVDFGRDLFPAMLRDGLSLRGYVTFEYIKDMGTPDRLDRGEDDLRSGKVARRRLLVPQKAVLIDRDGTLNRPAGHVARADELLLFEGVGSAIARLNRADYRCAVVTNQPVLARGECSAEDLSRIHAKLETLIGLDRAYLDGIFVCPHHPDSGFPGEVLELKRECDCRKPAPGLLLRAMDELSADPAQSWMVGDSAADIGAARAAGVRSILVRTGGARTTSLSIEPDFEVDDFCDAVNFILTGRDALVQGLGPALDRIDKGTLIRIAGQSRSGKSLVASVLRDLLLEMGHQVGLVRMDHWLRPPAERVSPGNPLEDFDTLALIDVIQRWRDGEALDLAAPIYSWETPTGTSGPRLNVPAGATLIVEGTLACALEDLDEGQTFDLFVECPEELRWRRFKAEYERRGADLDSIDRLYRQRGVLEHPVVQAQRERADLVVAVDLDGNKGQQS